MIKIFKDLIQTVGFLITSFTVSGKKAKKQKTKKSSENDQLTGHFQSFFICFFFRPPDPKSEKQNPVNQLIKKIWPYDEDTDKAFIDGSVSRVFFYVSTRGLL